MNENIKQESLADVIAEGRGYKGIPVPYAPARALWLDEFNSFLDRIEAAYKRDIEKLNSVIQATVSRSDAEIDRLRREAEELRKQIGNAAAMREALSDACYAMFNFLKTQNGGYKEMASAFDKAKAALAKPPRQCDVGTARQQERRHKEEVCLKSACPKHEGFVSKACKGCFAMWAQMPYEEREAGK